MRKNPEIALEQLPRQGKKSWTRRNEESTSAPMREQRSMKGRVPPRSSSEEGSIDRASKSDGGHSEDRFYDTPDAAFQDKGSLPASRDEQEGHIGLNVDLDLNEGNLRGQPMELR